MTKNLNFLHKVVKILFLIMLPTNCKKICKKKAIGKCKSPMKRKFARQTDRLTWDKSIEVSFATLKKKRCLALKFIFLVTRLLYNTGYFCMTKTGLLVLSTLLTITWDIIFWKYLLLICIPMKTSCFIMLQACCCYVWLLMLRYMWLLMHLCLKRVWVNEA